MTRARVIDAGRHPLADGIPPDWASGWGQDRHGVYVAFTVGDVTQRLRWIPPGRFLMGSPPGEPGRFADEGPRHGVVLGRGFWLADTACTQALYEAVTGGNPSRFKDPLRPVEQVSWEDTRQFFERVNGLVPGLDLVLPSEAQWEYACRAGTETPYSFGREISRSLANYEGNGTVPVGSLPPNAWGLYEMHGNVFEWCADAWHGSYEGAPADGSAWLEGGGSRVLRGGAWNYYARSVRAASRIGSDPGDRYDNLGFRCARVQV